MICGLRRTKPDRIANEMRSYTYTKNLVWYGGVGEDPKTPYNAWSKLSCPGSLLLPAVAHMPSARARACSAEGVFALALEVPEVHPRLRAT